MTLRALAVRLAVMFVLGFFLDTRPDPTGAARRGQEGCEDGRVKDVDHVQNTSTFMAQVTCKGAGL